MKPFEGHAASGNPRAEPGVHPTLPEVAAAQNGPYRGKLGTEHCATEDFQWLGLMFSGETEYRVFNIDDWQASD